MKEIVKLIVVLTLICVVAAVALAQVYAITKEPIAHEKRMELLGAIQQVVPAYTNEPDKDEITADGRSFYPGFNDGLYVGAAIAVSSDKGYAGTIDALVGVDAAGEVRGVRVLSMAETPGLGSKITDPDYLRQLVYKDAGEQTRRTLSNTDWRVRKDGGEIDQITGATISPRALTEAIRDGLTDYDKNKDRIAAAEKAAGDAAPAPEAEK